MASNFRETAAGQLIRFITRNRVLQYPEEKPDFKLPQVWLDLLNNDAAAPEATRDSQPGLLQGELPRPTSDDEEKQAERTDTQPYEDDNAQRLRLQRTKSRADTIAFTQDRLEADEIHEAERTKSVPIVPRKTKDGAILVDWYYSDDPENPQNWSNTRRFFVAFVICLYTFVVYFSSSIYTTSEQGIMEEFGVSSTKAALGLSIYVLGYGTGPMLFSPLSELASVGRNPVYILTMFVFVIVSIPAAVPHNYAGLMVLRFLQGFFGSPCLASGGASMGDMYSLLNLPLALCGWVAFAYCGPALGPLLSGFAVPVEGWRWSMLEIVWAAAPMWVAMFFFLPETSQPTILLRRAQRLRRLTGSARFMAQSEIDQRSMTAQEVVVDAMVKPLEITIKDPAIMFVQVYTAIIYAIYYSFFEVFPLVYPVYYAMSPGQVGLVFLCVLVACLLGLSAYVAYLLLYMNPRVRRVGLADPQEIRLVPALGAAFGPTIGLFIFAWTASPSIHWIAPTIGITLYGASVFVVMQCIFVYIPLSYARYAASLFAANDFFRSAFACGSVLFAGPMYARLGVARGTSLLGGLSTMGIVGIWLLYFYGARLRALSKFAVST